ncbi:MAG: chemotaxis protein CheC [Haloarculaceae archaeon]
MPLLVDVRKLTVVNDLIDEGAGNVADYFSQLTGADASVEIKSISFVDPADLSAEIGREETFTARIRLTEPPYGIFLMTFPEATAVEIASMMTGREPGGGITDQHRGAIQEMCNILTSGFIDGIANTLETTIDMETPTVERQRTDELAGIALSHVREDATAVVLDSVIDVADRDAPLRLQVFLVPDPGAFVNLVDMLDVGAAPNERERVRG